MSYNYNNNNHHPSFVLLICIISSILLVNTLKLHQSDTSSSTQVISFCSKDRDCSSLGSGFCCAMISCDDSTMQTYQSCVQESESEATA